MRRLPVLIVAMLLLVACNGEGEDLAVDETPEPALTVTPAPDPRPVGDATPTPERTPTPDVEPPTPLATDEWSAMADAPTARTEVAATALAGAVWVAGGFTADGQAAGVVHVYDPTFDVWQEGPSLPRGVHHAALVTDDEGVLLIGGYLGSGFDDPTDEVWRLDPTVGEWEQAEPLPEPRAAGAAAFDGERVVYGGGVGPGGLAGDVFVLEEGEWHSGGALTEAREHLAAASDGEGRVWFLAGRTGGLDTNLTAVDLVEAGEAPRRIGDVPTARGGVAGFYAPGVGACAVGGEEPGGTFDEVECVDAEGEVVALAPLSHARHGLGAVVVDGIAYTLLGGPEPGLTVSATVEALRLE